MKTSTRPSPARSLPSRDKVERAYVLTIEALGREGPGLLRWSVAHRVEEKGPLDFATFPFQVELYEAFGDRSLRTVDVMKSGQCGISAAAVSLALHAADAWQASVLYVLPTEDFAYQFSDTRVKTAIEGSPYLMARVAATDNKGLKKVGEAFVYLVGSVSERRALSIPADILILDEYDRLDQRNIPKFRKRLGSPTSLKLERRFSNPSFPETGIHKLYLDGDQREWLVRCPACRHEARMQWASGDGDHHVDEERAARVCGRCRRPLTRGGIAGGRWVPGRPHAGRRSYHVSKLVVPDEDVGALVEEHAKTDESSVQAHWNFDLGLPYSPKGGSLSRDTVLACRRDWACPPEYRGPNWVTAGVDVGRVLHVRVSMWNSAGRAVPLFLGTVDSFEDLAAIWRRYDVRFGLVDERPEERAARAFMDSFRGRCMLLRWAGDEQRDPLVVDEDNGLVVARRTGACDRLIAAVQEQRRVLPRDLPKDYLSQLTAPHRVTETNRGGQKVARYVSDGKDDHFFFAELHDLLAKEARGGPAAGVTIPPPPTIREQIQRSGWRRRSA